MMWRICMHSVFRHRYQRLVPVVLMALIFAVFVARYHRADSLAPTRVAKAKTVEPKRDPKLPRISEVLFVRTDGGPTCWVEQAQVLSTDRGFSMERAKVLYSGYWGEGRSEYRISPDGKLILISQESLDSDVSRKHSDLLLLSLTTGNITTLRGDAAGYDTLGWSSDGQLISYVSPMLLPHSLATDPPSSDYDFASYTSDMPVQHDNYQPEDRVLYISARDGKWRRSLQSEVTDAVWIPGHRVIVYASYNRPGLVVYSADGKKAVLDGGEGGGNLLLSGDGRKLLWQSGPRLRLLEVPANPSKLLDPKAWKIGVSYELDARHPIMAGSLSSDGRRVTLLGPGSGHDSGVAILDFVTGKSQVYSPPNIPYTWSDDNRHLIGAFLREDGTSSDLAAVRVDPASINHVGPIDWDNPQPVSPRILLEMPLQTKVITWSAVAR